MRKLNANLRFASGVFCVLWVVFGGQRAHAWSEHALLTAAVFEGQSEVRDAAPVKVEPLESFLSAEAEKLEKLLADEEEWARKNLRWYRPRPEELVFKAGGDAGGIRKRFCRAIRINPASALRLYLQLLPNEDQQGREVLPINQLTFLKDTSTWRKTKMVGLSPGELVPALAVLATASDEPDLGLDVGLFSDNGTECGLAYGFGRQPFGNPNLDYGSQAPFHMGFYHERRIVYFFAGFVKESYPECRVHLCKTLSRFAFETGHSYWGWRFAGWGLHYIGDLCQPYHSTVLPDVSTLRAIWVGGLSSIGIEKPKAKMIQLVSNRHLAFEKFAQIELHTEYLKGETNTPMLAVLRGTNSAIPYDDRTPRDRVAKFSHAKAVLTDRTVTDCMPSKYVSDPYFEFGTSSEQDQLLGVIRSAKGEAAVARLTAVCCDLLALYRDHGRAYVHAILSESGVRRTDMPR
ncbi:MAG: hypothetical protein QHJ82_10890 [Verrucomicrobiota bacterium]|nr:hypothetical protein [Verrucomicrobiota bacterium]